MSIALTAGSTAAILSRASADTMHRLGVHAREATTGMVADTGRHLGGMVLPLADIETRSDALDALQSGWSLAASRMDRQQTALDAIAGAMNDVRGAHDLGGTARADKAEIALETAVEMLRSAAAGRHLFGSAPDGGAPIAEAETLLAAGEAIAATAATPQDAADLLREWLAPGGVAEVSGLISSPASDLVATAHGAQSQPSPLSSADLRNALADLIAVAIADADPPSADGVVAVQAAIGLDQQVLDRRVESASAERTGLDLARNAILSVDPYEAATRLQAAELQLETIYAVTARLSSLSLTAYLR